MGLLLSHPDSCTVLTALRFEPDIGFVSKLSRAAESLKSVGDFPHWQVNAQHCVLRNPDRRMLLLMDHRQLQIQTLGLDHFAKHADQIVECSLAGLREFAVKELTAFEFRVTGFLDVGMVRREIADLMFGSFLQTADEFQSLCEDVFDASIEVWGIRDGFTVKVSINAMSAEDVSTSFMRTPNLRHFAEPQLLDARIGRFHEAIARNCFSPDIQLSRKNIPVDDLGSLLAQSLDSSDRIATSAVRMLKTVKPAGEVTDA